MRRHGLRRVNFPKLGCPQQSLVTGSDPVRTPGSDDGYGLADESDREDGRVPHE